FENEFVRVLDTNIHPEEITKPYTHKYPASLYFLSWSDFIRYNEEGSVLVDSKVLSKVPAAGSALWSSPLTAHCLKNTGDNDLHVISVEIKKQPSKE
ncbi:MAG TPA: hypothetical protein VL095_13055, partial [Flavisolibacter sp.]|nr:hypothetical protein [Flavisolibacter sp.]